MKNKTHILVQDNDSHWYVIPRDKQAEFDEWTELDGDDEAAWDEPEWADRVGGSPTLVTFHDEGYSIG